jgi:hypothetical protein
MLFFKRRAALESCKRAQRGTFNEIKSATRKAEDFSALRAASCELQQLTAAGDTLEFPKNVIYYVY